MRVPRVFDFGDIPVVRVVMTEVCVLSSFNGCWALIAAHINAFGQDVYTHTYIDQSPNSIVFAKLQQSVRG